MARKETLLRIVGKLRFDTDHLDVGIRELHASGDSADQPATADGTRTISTSGKSSRISSAMCLAGDDLFVVVGRDDLVVVSLRKFLGFGFAFVSCWADQNDLGSVAGAWLRA